MLNIDKYTCFNSKAELMHILTADNCRNNLCGSIKKKNQQNEKTYFLKYLDLLFLS